MTQPNTSTLSAAQQNVKDDLGEDVLKRYDEAVALREKDEENADELQKGTEIFVSVLTSVPQDKTKSAGYAELLLAYGATLLCFLRRTVAEESILGGDVEATLPKGKLVGKSDEAAAEEIVTDRSVKPSEDAVKAGEGKPMEEKENTLKVDGEKAVATSSDLKNANKPEKADEEEADATEGVGGDAEAEEDKDDVDELTWEQLEHARLTFEALGDKHLGRLAEVHETLGELLVATDQSELAAIEYGKAAEILSNVPNSPKRIIAQLQYRRYLALRRDMPLDAIAALEKGIFVFRAFSETAESKADDKEILKEMIDELDSFKTALGPALEQAENDPQRPPVSKSATNGNSSDAPIVVTPKRRVNPRPVPVQTVNDATDSAEPPAKKARIDTEAKAAVSPTDADAEKEDLTISAQAEKSTEEKSTEEK